MNALHYYHLAFPGQALGGQAVVKARSVEDAKNEIVQLYPAVHLSQIEVQSCVPVRSRDTEVVFHWDGDY